MNLTTTEIKTFVPASDFERSKAFYLALGFAIPWSTCTTRGDTSYNACWLAYFNSESWATRQPQA